MAGLDTCANAKGVVYASPYKVILKAMLDSSARAKQRSTLLNLVEQEKSDDASID